MHQSVLAVHSRRAQAAALRQPAARLIPAHLLCRGNHDARRGQRERAHWCRRPLRHGRWRGDKRQRGGERALREWLNRRGHRRHRVCCRGEPCLPPGWRRRLAGSSCRTNHAPSGRCLGGVARHRLATAASAAAVVAVAAAGRLLCAVQGSPWSAARHHRRGVAGWRRPHEGHCRGCSAWPRQCGPAAPAIALLLLLLLQLSMHLHNMQQNSVRLLSL